MYPKFVGLIILCTVFQKPKMANSCHVGNKRSPYFFNGLTDFDEICYSDEHWP